MQLGGTCRVGSPFFLSFEFLVSSFKFRVQGLKLESRNFETCFLSCTLSAMDLKHISRGIAAGIDSVRARGDRSPRILEEHDRRLFSRDPNYLRDVALFWPFVLYSIFGVASAFSPGYRQFAIRCAAVAVAALALAKETLLLFLVAVGFIAIQCAITLLLHSWDPMVFTAGVVTAATFFLVGRFFRKRKLTYKLPNEFRLVDALWSIASLIGSLLLGYFVSPFK